MHEHPLELMALSTLNGLTELRISDSGYRHRVRDEFASRACQVSNARTPDWERCTRHRRVIRRSVHALLLSVIWKKPYVCGGSKVAAVARQWPSWVAVSQAEV